MISRRLTKLQKIEILDAYKDGQSTNDIAQKYNCTPNTINRTVKTLISKDEYEDLKEKRSKINNRNNEVIQKEILKSVEDLEINLDRSNSFNSTQSKSTVIDQSIKIDDDFYNQEVDELSSLALEDADDFGTDLTTESQDIENNGTQKKNHDFDNNFEEIAPLASVFDFDLDKPKLDFQILNQDSLPESVYMLVDKKVELDTKLISDLPEWSFLPENELKRNAILLFPNQRSAKRSCSRNQRVIKIPNTNVFKISKPYLVSKGITRLILEDSIIALDD